MDAEDMIWMIFSIVIVSIAAVMLIYSVFVAVPDNNRKIALCEQAGGVAIADDGRYRLCVDTNSVIEINISKDLKDGY